MPAQPIGSSEETWLFADPLGRQWVLYFVPLDPDHTLAAHEQPKALVLTCEDGWPFVVPVGPGFRVEELSMEALAQLVRIAEGDVRRQSDWEPFRIEPRIVNDPTTGSRYRVRTVSAGPAGEGESVETVPEQTVLLFSRIDEGWHGRVLLDPGTTMESLSLDDLRVFLRYALEREAEREGCEATEGASPERVATLQRSGSEGERVVLLVEDHPELRRIYRIALENAGYAVVDVADGGDALLLVESDQHRLRAVISDVVLPRVGGRELFWRLSEDQPGVPIILMSGLLDRTEAASALDPAPLWFIEKPFTPEVLIRLLQRVLNETDREARESGRGE